MSPCIDPHFGPMDLSVGYVSGTTDDVAINPYVWGVNFKTGGVYPSPKSGSSSHVRAVRGGLDH